MPVAAEVSGDERVRADVLPAGSYATLIHLGPFDGLRAANAALEEWAEAERISLDRTETERGPTWRARLERYLTNPSEEPDSSKWETEVAFRVAGD